AGGRHAAECWALDLFDLGGLPLPQQTESGDTVRQIGGAVTVSGRHLRVTVGMAAISRHASVAQPNLVEFARRGTLRDEAHRAAVQAELATLVRSVGSDAESRPLARLLEILPSAPVGVCVH